jgi:hypothetical protein
MENNILIVKRKKDRFQFKVKNKKHNLYNDPNYKSVINIKDPKQLAMLLEDLKILFDAPIDKAFVAIRDKNSPFW